MKHLEKINNSNSKSSVNFGGCAVRLLAVLLYQYGSYVFKHRIVLLVIFHAALLVKQGARVTAA